jgi:pimeloyl-ACP methyl ester carboxylesterase
MAPILTRRLPCAAVPTAEPTAAPPPAPPIREHRVPLPSRRGLVLSVRERPGAGAPFLLVHGLASNARLWDGVGAHLAADGHRVVAVDLRGHGRSDRGDGDFGHAAVADDLVAVADALGLDRPVLAGQSWGGNVVVHAAARHPDRWRAVAAVDGGTIDLAAAFPDRATAWAVLQPPPLRGTPVAQLRDRFSRVMAGWPEGAVDAALACFSVAEDGTASPRLALEDHRAIVEAMVDEPPGPVYGRIRVPVLLLPVGGGEAAWARRKEDAVAAALAALPDGRATWLEGHHDVHLQQPAVVAAALRPLAAAG